MDRLRARRAPANTQSGERNTAAAKASEQASAAAAAAARSKQTIKNSRSDSRGKAAAVAVAAGAAVYDDDRAKVVCVFVCALGSFLEDERRTTFGRMTREKTEERKEGSKEERNRALRVDS